MLRYTEIKTQDFKDRTDILKESDLEGCGFH